MLQQLRNMLHINEEHQNLIRSVSGVMFQAMSIAGLVLTYYSCEDEVIEKMGIGIGIAGYLLEHVIEYLENVIKRREYNENKRDFAALEEGNPNIAEVHDTASRFKTYGIKSFNWPTWLPIASYTVGSIMALVHISSQKPSHKKAAIACSSIGIGLHWLNQKLISHNIEHEIRLFKKAKNDIVAVKLRGLAPPSQTNSYHR